MGWVLPPEKNSAFAAIMEKVILESEVAKRVGINLFILLNKGVG